ncbi:MAG TPA: hypothetical protein VLH75_19065 [Longimicrobiales bacterium]|nr:hypothetical protein [Longimicrobiales bacterium]
MIPLELRSAFRSSWTDDRDNGALWAGKGASALLRVGMAYAAGPLRLVLAPEVTVASNGAFPLADAAMGYSAYSTPWMPFDLVRRWGKGPVHELRLGQSVAEVRWRGMAVGASSANQVRGPEARYPIILGASGPGVPSAFFEVGGRPGPVGRVAVRVQYGMLRESPYFDGDPDNDRLLFTLFTLDWAPAFAPGLALGTSFTYRDPVEGALMPSMLLQPFRTRSAQSEDQLNEDGMAAAHARWDVGRVGVWGTWARADGALDVEDLLTDTDHAQLWTVGGRTSWTAGGVDWVFTGEASSSVGRALRQPRLGSVTSTSRHGMAFQGHTHQGQPLGSSIGPGASAWWLSVLRTSPGGPTLGAEVEHVTRDLDVHFEVFKRRDGSSGEDREWRFGVLYQGPIPRFAGRLADVPGVSVRANGGLSLRWNRDYIRYSSNAHLVGPRESQIFLDLALTWDPSAKR